MRIFFFLQPLRQIYFSVSPSVPKKDFPPDQFFIRRLTEQARPLALTLYSLIPPQPSTPPPRFLSLTHTVYIAIHRGPHTQPTKPAEQTEFLCLARADDIKTQNRKG